MKYRNDLKRRVLAGLFAGAALCLAAPAALAANSPVANNQLPAGGHVVAGDATVPDILKPGGNPNGATSATITQNSQNAVIVWDNGFNVGANATVNFEGPQGGYSTLNYDKGGSMSQIYGTINANNNGNIYIVNPAGVEIGNSAQINVGSLYVSNKKLDNELENIENKDNPNIGTIMSHGTIGDAVLMSLGNINANTVTFEGNRIVIDTERLKTGDGKMTEENIIVHTTDKNNVVIGYDAYNEGDNKGTYEGKQVAASSLATIDEKGQEVTNLNAYMWVEDVEQLQAIDTNLGGNYALRNSIDATATQEWNNGEGFKPIGIDSTGKVIVENRKYGFHGNFDGLSYNIFNLNINRTGAVNVGLFGVLHEAEINNVTFVGGAITGGNVVGSLAGAVLGNTHVNNVMNSASVTGGADVGGIIGYSGDEINQEEDSDKQITVGNADAHFSNMVNTGTVVSSGTSDGNGGTISDAGGLIGNLYQGTLDGTSYNLGSVTGKGHNVGGLVGHAVNSVIGNEDMIDEGENVIAEGTTVYNRLNVTGAYNVGGIVGNMEGTKVYNAENSGNVLADGYMKGTYTYHTDHSGTDTDGDGLAKVDVDIANAGGIAGSASGNSTITDVLNTGNVSSASDTFTETVTNVNGNGTKDVTSTYYTAGNVGGIVGSAVDTNITNATNRENEIRGAHNVGGIAGYFTNSNDNDYVKKYTIKNGINDGGDIMATGAWNGKIQNNIPVFIKETIRGSGRESFTVGNMGGIVGYMDGNNVYIASSANRGTVHTLEPENGQYVGSASKAANAGGIVGKIDRSNESTLNVDTLKTDYSKAAVSNSYNTGDVMGYTGIGGVAGMMYNGEIAGSYNLGNLRTTRQSRIGTTGSIDPINMGGIVGDTTEESSAQALLYDVYNKGQIGDANYDYFGRHVGGIVGRLSGTVEKAYNTGAIYNGYNVVGGIAGWMYTGSIKNSFNTGNITVYNQNDVLSQMGGIVGATGGDASLTNVYNLGTLRSFKVQSDNSGYNFGNSSLGGIIGQVRGGKASIKNAYTTGNLYINDINETGHLGSMVGHRESGNVELLTNTYYIKPETEGVFSTPNSGTGYNANVTLTYDEATTDSTKWNFGFTGQNDGAITGEEDWRWYKGTTPILNAFLPNSEKYFSDTEKYPDAMNGISSIQYGTAYDPLLTIIKANGDKADLDFNWQELGINNDAGLAVYGAGLTLNDFMSTGGSGYFGGLIYSDGALTIKADTAGGNPHSITGDVALGSASQLYGSSVAINADGQVTIYGSVTATGNKKDGTDNGNQFNDKNNGDISIIGGSVDIYGQLTSAKYGDTVRVPGINGMAKGWSPTDGHEGVEHPEAHPEIPMSDIGDRFGYTTGASAATGSISITANDAEDGHVNIYYGNKGEGIVTTGGDLTVTASGDVYMDSDLSIGGDLSLKAGDNSEVVLDISNIGKVQAANGMVTDALTGLHAFLDHFAQEGKNITLKGDETKLAVDMWGDGAFDLTKYDLPGEDEDTLAYKLDQLHINGEIRKGKHYTYIWVSTGEQLAGIQDYKDKHQGSNILSYNFALKNDIDASNVTDYKAIGSGEGNEYTGTFDGRDNRIIGLDTTKTSNGSSQTLTNAGIFDTIGADGTVEDLRVYSGTFHGTNNAGAVAGVNNGNISNVTTFGNVVESANHAGGIAGENSGTISGASAIGTSTVTADKSGGVAGGIAGTNSGTISDSSANSAVDSSSGDAAALGGVAGVNEGTLINVDSLGVTTGVYKGNTTQYSDNVGGIAGINQAGGTVESAYNESIVSGRDNVGGILGVNHAAVKEGEDSLVSNVANASSVTGESAGNDSEHVGGLVGDNEGSITNGRNNGEITGNNYVGGLVGANGAGSTLTNLVNDSAAAITGDNYVGGIAGSNAGTISADESNDNLINRGTITGQMYVGGVAGENTGKIANTHNDVELHVRYDVTETTPAKYFGGVAGINGHLNEDGTVSHPGTITSATNTNDIIAPEADYVGGIVGWNPKDAILNGMGNSNEGRVEGASHVGGVAGRNDAEIDGSGTEEGTVGIFNSGVVIAHKGGAGGIFGENTGAISHAELTNNGIVSGTYSDKEGENGTGGIFGVNSGSVTYSSLKNEINGQVMGTQNVGGLIGMNTGDITGGRTDKTEDGQNVDNGYYKYQIYNNGTIQAGTWNDDDKDGIVDEGELDPAKTNSQNIAGLFGINSGKVTAGYNTGAINAGSSSNVGGIAGTNAGTLDQVFNTVITADGQNQTITGGTNVGGIAGTNSGTISNAYNTTAVTGINDTGSIAGSSTGIVENVYATVSGSLVGNGGVIKNDTGYVVTDNDQWKQSSSYNGFDFDSTDTDGTESIWKIYEGSTNPLLKVFLTKVTVNPDKLPDFAADGNEHKLNVGDLIQSGALTAPGGIGFGAFGQNQNLIQSNGHSAMGTYYDWLYSMQIAASGEGGTFNPNLLGYDIDLELGIGLPPDTMEPPVNEHWNFLFDDNPWDRNRDFRERKAEVHYIAGGMTL